MSLTVGIGKPKELVSAGAFRNRVVTDRDTGQHGARWGIWPDSQGSPAEDGTMAAWIDGFLSRMRSHGWTPSDQATVRYTKTTITVDAQGQRHVTVEKRDSVPEADKRELRELMGSFKRMVQDMTDWLC